MSKGSKAPPPPDPRVVAAAQTAQNVGTAIAQSNLNNVNQVTPYGNLTYSQTGEFQWTDPNNGQVHTIPQFTATQTLSEAQDRLRQTQEEADQQLATIGRDQAFRIGDLLGTPVDLSNEATEARLMELGRARLDPALDRRRETVENQLVQRGIMPGSTGYDREMMRLREAENDAYNQLLLTGRGQAVQEALTERNQPINETTALLSGSQVTAPSFITPNPAQIANVDRAGLEMQAYNQRLAAWQQQQQSRSGLLGGLFGAAGNIGAAAIMASDRRVKEAVRMIGWFGRLPVYLFRYIGAPATYVGFMADEVARIVPDAVLRHESGFLMVDYDKAMGAAA